YCFIGGFAPKQNPKRHTMLTIVKMTNDNAINRRDLLRTAAMAGLPAAAAAQATASLVVDPHPKFDISPWLYMQFMEPLGVTDSSVEASWDYDRDDWRKDLIDAVKDLAPGAMRYGGLFS